MKILDESDGEHVSASIEKLLVVKSASFQVIPNRRFSGAEIHCVC